MAEEREMMTSKHPLKIFFAQAKMHLTNSPTIMQGDDYMPP